MPLHSQNTEDTWLPAQSSGFFERHKGARSAVVLLVIAAFAGLVALMQIYSDALEPCWSEGGMPVPCQFPTTSASIALVLGLPSAAVLVVAAVRDRSRPSRR